jgi:hypothetical protein
VDEPELVEAAPVAEAEADAEAEAEAEALLEALGLVEGRPVTEAEAELAGEAEPEPEAEPELEPEASEPDPEAEEEPEPVAEAGAAEETKPDFSAARPVLEEAAAELEEVEALQVRSYRGVVLSPELETPKLGLAPSSLRMYHQVLVLPKRGQATSSQYCLALAVLATARFWLSPVTGQPVSVIQTSLLPATALVLATPVSKRDLASSMELALVFSKKGYPSKPSQSTASMTAELELLDQEFQVST